MAWSILHSLRARLLGLLLLAILVSAAAQSLVVYRQARTEADAIFDYHMVQMAQALRAGVAMPSLPAFESEMGEVGDFDFLVQVWNLDGSHVFKSNTHGVLPQRAVLGFSEMQLSGVPYRVYSLQTRFQVVQIAQDMTPRRRMARELALRTVAPIGWMAPLLMLLAWWVVSASLRPIERVRAQVAKRQADDLAVVVEDGLPDEIAPLVHELNLLFSRVRSAFEAQQHFVADAAHELRSPLAALRLQVQGLQRARDEASRAVALERLLAGIDRSTRLVEQLLLLARQQASASSGLSGQTVDLSRLAEACLSDAAVQAQQKGIDLGLAQAEAGQVVGQVDALRILLRNLLDNAIRYSPSGGRVDVSVTQGPEQVVLLVEDSGPGIGVADRARVLDRFYRVQGAAEGGSGLGLAIVAAIAESHHAGLQLGESQRLGGLQVRVVFPVARAGDPSQVLRPAQEAR